MMIQFLNLCVKGGVCRGFGGAGLGGVWSRVSVMIEPSDGLRKFARAFATGAAFAPNIPHRLDGAGGSDVRGDGLRSAARSSSSFHLIGVFRG
jgi:hypothetical protein